MTKMANESFTGGRPSDRLNPSFSPEMEEAGVPETLPSVIMGPPAYASPDPETSAVPLLPLDDRPADAALSADYAADEIDYGNETSLASTLQPLDAAGATEQDDSKKKAGDWISEVEAASTEEELDAIGKRYDESGADFSTVDKAFEKRSTEINEQ